MRNHTSKIGFSDGDIVTAVTTELAKSPDNPMVMTLNGTAEIRSGVTKMLRIWADEWIDSALKPNGAEMPAARKLPMSSSREDASWALFQFSQRWIGVLPGPVDGRPALSMADPEQIFKEMRTDQDEAKFYLALLLLTPFRDYIAKCRRSGCGRYFALKQVGREYPTGTICPACAQLRDRKQSADSMSANRQSAELKLYDLIAAHFHEATTKQDWHSDRNLRNRMTAFVNRQIATDEKLRPLYTRRSRVGITSAWFNRAENKAGIEEAASDYRRAKDRRAK